MSRLEKTFKIGAVAKLTGISTHALRVWERRYGLEPPSRTPGGGRLYSEAQVDRLRLLKTLINRGHGIAQIAHLPSRELKELVAAHTEQLPENEESAPGAMAAAKFLEAITGLDVAQAERTLGHAAVALEPRTLIDEVLVPIFEQVGERWSQGQLSVAEEHAASSILRNQLGALMRLFAGSRGHGPVLAATLSGELHEFGALLAALTAAVLGWRVLYLGPNLPAEHVVWAARRTAADVVMLSVVYRDAKDELLYVRRELPRAVSVLAGGRAIVDARVDVPGLTVIPTLRALDAWLRRRARAREL